MTQKRANPAGEGGALKRLARQLDGTEYSTTGNFPQRAPRVRTASFARTTRGMLRGLDAAARAGRLTSWEANFVVSLQRQAAHPRWRPSRRQDAVIRRLHAGLAETEVTLYATESGFTVIDPDEGDKKDADILIVGEGMSEYATRHGNLISVRARLEVKAIDVDSGEIIAIDRHTSVAVGLTERIAGKSALQSAAASIAERLLPKVVKPGKKKDKRKKKG